MIVWSTKTVTRHELTGVPDPLFSQAGYRILTFSVNTLGQALEANNKKKKRTRKSLFVEPTEE